jgi:myo-inositol-1(or 4)-monophosphatase
MAYADELRVAKAAAKTAGATMEQYRQDGFAVDRKSAYNDLVTGADRACQEQIIDTINAEFPEDGFLAEENDRRPDGEDRVWVIDPIDGTRNYAHDLPLYCTSIALRDGDEVVVGAVYAPRTDALFTAVRGEGAWLNGDMIATSDRDQMRGALIAARMSDYTPDIHDMERAILEDLLERDASFRRIGSAALDLCHVAAGRFDGHILVTINEWDVAAGGLIVEEAGGSFRRQDAVVDGQIETVATNGLLTADITAIVDRHVSREQIQA